MDGYQPNNFCAICKGQCCKTLGCAYSPDDFSDLSFDGLKNEIDKGHISIDWWEGDPTGENEDMGRAFFLRSRNLGARVVDASWGGVCNSLTESGCSISFENRPKEGRYLEPRKEEGLKCVGHYSKQQSCIDWLQHESVLRKLYNYY